MRHILCLFTLCAALLTNHALAQGNILGLPAVPQTPVQPAAQPAPQAGASAPKAGTSAAAKNARPSASAARAGASGAKPGAALPQESINDVEDKSVLSGGVTMASSYEGKIATVRVTTNNVYQGEVYRSQALKAARLVQRDLALSCAWQCKPAPMPAPQILADGKLQFVMAIDNYPRVLSYDDMITMLLGKPLAVMPKPAVTPTAAPPSAKTPAAAPSAVPVAAPVAAPPATPVATPAPVPAPPNALPPGVVRSTNISSFTSAAPAQ